MLPAWVRRQRWVRLRFYAGGRADEAPRAIVVGGEEEPVELTGSWLEDRGGTRVRRLRLRLPDRSELEVEGDGERWQVLGNQGGGLG